MKKHPIQNLFCLFLIFGRVLSDSSTKLDDSNAREFSRFDTDEFLNFDDDRPSVVVKTSRVTSSSSAVSTSLRRSLVGRGSPSSTTERTTTPMATILKQINEHNEDGSYTYGYEASDGSFKLETRYPDGRVQGKYGYVDINGEQKVIEYGADMLGFQPQGDLPEGIIVPPPVFNNETEGSEAQAREPITDYDYDYSGSSDNGERSRFVVRNRARVSSRPSARPSVSAPTRERDPSHRQPLQAQPKLHFVDRFQGNIKVDRPRHPVPHPITPTAAPVHKDIDFSRSTAAPFAPTLQQEPVRPILTTTTTTTTTPRTITTTAAPIPSIVEVPQVPRKIRIHHASRLTTTPPPKASRTSSPSRKSLRSRRPLPSSGSPDPLEALKAFMLSNGPFVNFGSAKQHTPRRLRPPHRSGQSTDTKSKVSRSRSRDSSSSRGTLPSRASSQPTFTSSSSFNREDPPTPTSRGSPSRFSSFPARSNNQGANSLRQSSPTTTPTPHPPQSSQTSLKLPPSFQEQRRPIRILTSAVPGASLNRLPSVTEKPKPGEIVPTDVDFDALIQEFTGQRRFQESDSSSVSSEAFPHFSRRTSGPSSLELFADFS